jgi:PAS domain S-box-containing protein
MSLAEHDIREFLEHLSEGFLVTDQTGSILYTNNRLSEMFGYPTDALIGESVETLIPDRVREQHTKDRGEFFHKPTRRTMGSGRDLMGRRKDGSEIPIEVSLAPISRD